MKSLYKVRFVPLGGIVGVTKNCYLYELYREGTLQDILIVDLGIGFPSSSELGVDLIIPDVSYLKDKKDKIRALLLTHGHEDHIGAIPYLYEIIGKPPIYTYKLTELFVQNKMRETGIHPNITVIQHRKPYQFGGFSVKFLNITHSIPDTTHILIESPVGTFYHGPDFKLDVTPPYGDPPDFYEICKAGHNGVLALFSDALGAFREGLTLSESAVGQTFENEMRKTKGKFIMTTIASNISRIRQCVEAAVKFNRKVVFLGRSMEKNTTSAAEIGYLPIPKALIGDEEDILRLPASKLCIIATGAFGQGGSAISRIAMGSHKFVKIKPGDKVFFSADPIPGTGESVNSLVEELSMKGAEVVYHEVAEEDLHASGHGSSEDLKFLLCFTRPKYAVPIGSTIRHHLQYQKLAASVGMNEKNVFMMKEGETIEFDMEGKATEGEPVETRNVYVDAYGVGDVGHVVLRDRKTLSSDGIVVAIVSVNNQGKIIGKARILSRGFVYEKTEHDLLEDAGNLIGKVLQEVVHRSPGSPGPDYLHTAKREVVHELEEFFFDITGRRPLVVVEIIQI